MKKFLITVMVVLATVIGGNALMNTDLTAQAQAGAAKVTKLKATPKKIRGTWYHYDKKYGMNKVVITKHKVSFRIFNGKKYTHKMTTFPNQVVYKYTRKHQRTIYAFNSKTEIGDAAGYYMYTMKIKGKKHHVLVDPSQSTDHKPSVYTHFQTKHAYFAPKNTQPGVG
ncbi:hypothetical protein ACUIJQ_03965 [Levilactobacillus hammesii]|uniref:Extracellular protein n=1 Tax=Levilactobacillus hammesii DSM 16381 TaxID=1423753 RepID=A0A0R1ULN2_9LACO|nr:hypothetical protein [Levilactobacillus hammesii]KRL94191.1 hypothetical protein FD28_GL000743 [Levilactobacillus hammesii DSM 16381]